MPVKGRELKSRKTTVIVLAIYAAIYAGFAAFLFYAYNRGGIERQHTNSSYLTTILAVIGASISLFSKITTGQLTLHYRQGVSSRLLSPTGLSFKHLKSYDRFFATVSKKCFISLGFWAITVPVGVFAIAGNALLKKAFILELQASSMPCISTNSSGFPFNTTTFGNASVSDAGAVFNCSTMIQSISTNKSQLQGSVYAAQYLPKNGIFASNTDYFGTAALPRPILERQTHFKSISATNISMMIAQAQTNITERPSLQSRVLGNGGNLVTATLYDGYTFGLRYEEDNFRSEARLGVYESRGDTTFASDGLGSWVNTGGEFYLDTTWNQQIVTTTLARLDYMTMIASDIVDNIKRQTKKGFIADMSEEDQIIFQAQLRAISAILGLAFFSASSQGQGFDTYSFCPTTLGQTLIFGNNYYAIIVGVIFATIAACLAIWACDVYWYRTAINVGLLTGMGLAAEPSTFTGEWLRGASAGGKPDWDNSDRLAISATGEGENCHLQICPADAKTYRTPEKDVVYV